MTSPDFYWIAHYDNGSTLPQYTPDGGKHTYADIDRARLTAFELRQGERTIVVVDFRDDTRGDPQVGQKRLIWRKRHLVRSDGTDRTVHLVGWQRTVAGRNVQSICYVNEAGEVVLGGQWMDDKPFMHAIAPLECETDLS